jgi:DNA-directed RNA polymerase subunit omega
MKDDYLRAAQNIIGDPMILINIVSRRVRQLKFGAESFVDSLEWLSPEDMALREIIEGKISYEFVDGKTSR